MNWQRATIIFVLVVIVAIAGYDVLAIVEGGTEASISHLLITWSYKYPAFPFVIGFVMGHLFWRMPSTKETKKLLGGDE
jgi:hypothetical protein